MKKIFNHLTIMAAIAMTACSGARTDNDVDERRLSVTVSLPPQATIAEAIGGDSIDVNTIIGTGVNPESFEPGVGVMRTVSSSDLLLLSGSLGFEEQLASKIAENNPDITIADTSAGIEKLYGTHSHCDAHGGHDHHDDVADPHTWTSVKNARVIARNILAALVTDDPDRADYYTSRYRALDARLDSLDRAVAERLEPLSGSSFLVWHPSLSYFARDYGLQQISIGTEGRESSVRGIKDVIDRARESQARVLFIQADFDSSRAEAISRQTGATVVNINPLDPDWESQINIITDALTAGL